MLRKSFFKDYLRNFSMEHCGIYFGDEHRKNKALIDITINKSFYIKESIDLWISLTLKGK